MTTCPACGGSVSKKAVTCPHCGHPLKKNSRGCGTIILGILVLTIICTALTNFAENLDTQSKAPTKADPIDTLVRLQIAAEESVKTEHLSPSTAKFDWTQTEINVHEDDQNLYEIIGTVDSQNIFGGMIRSQFTLYLLDYGGDQWETLGLIME